MLLGEQMEQLRVVYEDEECEVGEMVEAVGGVLEAWDGGADRHERLYDELEERSEALLSQALSYAEGVLAETEGMKPEQALKVINRATSVAKQLIEMLKYLRRADDRERRRGRASGESGDADGEGAGSSDGSVDTELLADVRKRVSRAGAVGDADEAGA